MQRVISRTTPRLLSSLTLVILVLSACAPPRDMADSAPVSAEPTLAAPSTITERKVVLSPCEEDDDGIGGTGCRVE